MSLAYFKEHYGDLASVVGLLVTMVGFLATIRNVRKARRAAEEARQAARLAVARLNSQLLANELGAALERVRETDAAIRECNWDGAVYRCDEARFRLASLLENHELREAERELIRVAFDDFGMILPDLQKLRNDVGSKAAGPRLAKRLHKIIEALSRTKGRLQSSVMEM
jgi:hypothetical protein